MALVQDDARGLSALARFGSARGLRFTAYRTGLEAHIEKEIDGQNQGRH